MALGKDAADVLPPREDALEPTVETKFLYESMQAKSACEITNADWFPALFGLGWMAGYTWMCAPFLSSLLFIPRRWTEMRYFCWKAELVPETEQLVFYKSNLFGGVLKTAVYVSDLEKVTAEEVPNHLIWNGNIFDKELVFRDNSSKELFVFDKNGMWNEDTLKHPLIY